jgi:iron-sulfur cluster repair protein YtfE (RIC family)
MFHQIHKGLRALLYETAIKLQQSDFWHLEDAEECLERISEVIALFEKHADSEDTVVFPAIEKYEPSIADAFLKEHVEDHILSEKLNSAIIAYRAAPTINEKIAASRQIHIAFTKFLVFNIEHMAKEEEVLNPLLWRYYSDKDLLELTQRIVKNIAHDKLERYNSWMMRGLNNQEITGWLKEVEKHAPEEVFQALFVTAEKELAPRRFREVLECLTEGAMLA